MSIERLLVPQEQVPDQWHGGGWVLGSDVLTPGLESACKGGGRGRGRGRGRGLNRGEHDFSRLSYAEARGRSPEGVHFQRRLRRLLDFPPDPVIEAFQPTWLIAPTSRH
jgi:hypothetical protein